MNLHPHPAAPAPFYDVAIVGFGPVGATLANLLSLKGLTVLVLEREAAIYPLPRAIHFDGECMRLFQTLGIAEELAAQVRVSRGMKFVDANGRELIDWSRPQQPGPHGWYPSYRFHQPELEALLRRKLLDYPGVELRLRHDLYAVDQQADHVCLRFEDMSNGRLLSAQARYVVGCDGARSLVRRLMGTELDDLQSHERWLVLDVLLKRERPDLGDHTMQYCDPRRPATYARGVGMRRRWELMLMPGDDPIAMVRPEMVWPLLSRWVTPEDATLERPAVYTFHSVVARGWRRERLLIAGDAAHQTPPFMGQGLCAGLRDVANLAWKLADVVRGQAPDSLLDSYESERAPHVREFIETAVRLGSVIQETDPERVRQRDAEMSARPEIFSTPDPALGPGAHDGGSVDGGVEGCALAGRIAAQVMLDDGQRLDDLIGYQFALIAVPELARLARARLASTGWQLVIADQAPLRDWLARMGAQAVLMRPDRYVSATAGDEKSLSAVLERWSTPALQAA